MNKLRELRKEKGVYQKEIADLLNKSITCICDWERGRTEPDIEDLKILANYFGCTVDYIIGNENEQGIVYVMGNKLSKSEEKLIDKLRQLEPIKKEIAYRYIDFLFEEQKNK